GDGGDDLRCRVRLPGVAVPGCGGLFGGGPAAHGGHYMRESGRAQSAAGLHSIHDVRRACRRVATIRRTQGNRQGRGPTRVPAAVHPHRDLGHGDPMTTRYLMRLGKTPFDVVDPFLTLDRNLLGTNSGNLIYGAVAHKLFSTKDTEVDANYYRINAGMAAAVNDEYDGFILPLANAFRPEFEGQLLRTTQFLERLTIPFVMLSGGAQLPLDGDP